jgi:peptidoglycan/LPS O-acetylase OafA/YrhL
MEFINALNGLRGFAFLNVILDHYTYPKCIIDIGQFGVVIFFILSSYLLTMQLYKQYIEKNTLNLANYCVRRIFRIYPCLICALICEYFTKRLSVFEIKNIFFLTGFVGFYWAIYIEMRFYVVIPIIVLIFGKIKNLFTKFFLMSIITAVGFYYHYYLNFQITDPKNFRRFDINNFSFEKNIVFVNYVPVFLLGSFMAIIVYHLKNSKHNFNSFSFLRGAFILFMCLIHGPIIYFKCLNELNFLWGIPLNNFSLIFGSGYVIAIMFLNGNNFMTSLFENKVIFFIGEISYPAYLFHTIVREYFFKFYQWKISFPDLFSCAVITIIISYLLHITVEKFFINFTKSWFFKKEENKTESCYDNMNINDNKRIDSTDTSEISVLIENKNELKS